MSAIRWIVLSVTSVLLGGCGFGLAVPETQEFPGTPGDSQFLVQAIIQSVHCEVVNAVNALYDEAKEYPSVRPMTDKMRGWGAQMALTLKTSEKSTLNPSGIWTPVSPSNFTLGAALLVSSEATRTDILNYYYKVSDLRKRHHCSAGVQPDAPVTSLLIQSDLKLKEWLFDQIAGVATKEVDIPAKQNAAASNQNVLSHQVDFEVISTGGVTPAWKLVTSNFNQSGSLFEATRDRTHTLLITFGPGDDAGLTGAAASQNLASQIGVAVSNNMKRVSGP